MLFDEFDEPLRNSPLADAMPAIIDYRGKSPRKTQDGIPLITAKIVKDGRIEEPREFIAVDDYAQWMRRGIPQEGDVVMTTEAPLGEIAQLDDRKVALAQRLITLRGKSGTLVNTFLKFAMQSEFVQNQLKARATGTTVLGIRQSELRKVLLPIPPLEEQYAIGRLLAALDHKMVVNRQMVETLDRALLVRGTGMLFSPESFSGACRAVNGPSRAAFLTGTRRDERRE